MQKVQISYTFINPKEHRDFALNFVLMVSKFVTGFGQVVSILKKVTDFKN